MTLALTSYEAVESNLFVKIEVEYYKATPGATPSSVDLLFTDRMVSTSLAGDTYVGLGKLVSITSTNSELRATSNDLTITISGIPNTSIAEIINSRIKGSIVTILRGLYDATTGQFLSSVTGNPVTRFKGFVNNVSLEEDYDVENRISTNTIVLTCSNIVDIFENKIAGRKTNPSSMKKFYSTDISMDKVPNLENTEFDFGAGK